MSVDETAAKNYSEMLAKTIDDVGYCSDKVFNADKTWLFFKKMSS